MRKILVGAALISLVGFGGIQSASAFGGYGYCGQNFDDGPRVDSKILDEFRTENNAIRKEIVVKRSELKALFNQDNPDEKRVAQLTGELFDLQNKLDSKAAAKGLGRRAYNSHGPQMMYGNDSGYGRGREMMYSNGFGYGHGPQMMLGNGFGYGHGPQMMYTNSSGYGSGREMMYGNGFRSDRGSERRNSSNPKNGGGPEMMYGNGFGNGRHMMDW